MPDLKQKEIERYLQSVLGAQVRLLGMAVLGSDHQSKEVKGFGYGRPIRVDFQINGRERRAAVLHTMRPARLATNTWRIAHKS